MKSTNAQLNTKIDEFMKQVVQMSFEINNELTKLESDLLEKQSQINSSIEHFYDILKKKDFLRETLNDISKKTYHLLKESEFCYKIDVCPSLLLMSSSMTKPTMTPTSIRTTTSEMNSSMTFSFSSFYISAPSKANIQKHNGEFILFFV